MMIRCVLAVTAGLLAVGGADVARAQEKQEQPHYSIDTSRSTAELKNGEKGRLSIIIQPAAGKRVHDQAPLSVNLKAAKGLTVAKPKLGHADVVNKGEKAPELVVEITATAPGPQVTEAEMQFFICADKWCERMMQKVSITTMVK